MGTAYILDRIDWERLSDHDAPPWLDLRGAAERVAASPALALALADVVAAEPEPTDAGSRVWLTRAATLALAAPDLSDETKRAVCERMLGLLTEANPEDDLAFETVEIVVGRLGPTVLPEVTAALDRDEDEDPDGPSIITLWALMALGAATDDPALRALVIERCERALQRAIDDPKGEDVDLELCGPAAWVLADMGHEPARPLLTKLAKRKDVSVLNRQVAVEFRGALAVLDDKEPKGRPVWDDIEPLVDEWWEHVRRAPGEEGEAEGGEGSSNDPSYGHARAPDEPKVGRNDPCPCGSGKKYKKCCLGEA